MQVSVETAEGLKRRLKVQVPSSRVEEAVQNRLRDMRGKVKLQGFRPGKVPFKVVEQRYGPQVRGEVLDEVVRSTYAEALEENALRPAGAPEIQPLNLEAGQDLEYEASFEIIPTIEIQGIEAIELTRPAVDIDDEDIDRIMQRLLRQHADYSEVDRAAAEGDRITIDFEGKVDGEDFAGNTGEDVPVPLGEGQMPGPFEEQLIGLKAGDDKTLDYEFPEAFPDEQIAGKTAQFLVKVKQVEAPELPEADDAFAEKLGMEGGIEAVRNRIAESLERERDQAVRARLKGQVMEALLEKHAIELPQTLVDQELEQLRQQSSSDSADDLPSDTFEKEARRRVNLGLVVNEIVRGNQIQLDGERLQQALRRVAAGYEQPEQVMQYYVQNPELMQTLQMQVMEDQVVDWVVEQAQVAEQTMSLEALTSGANAEDDAEEQKE